jgi:hypothetical protein
MHVNSDMEAQLIKLSPSTMDRMLRPYRQKGGRKPLSATRRSKLLKSAIPIRTFAEWKEDKPGFLEIDTVAHCGESLAGFYVNTLCGVDVATGWIEPIPVWGKGQEGKIIFTVSRPYKKNDSCYVEQKIGNIIRRLVGYDRYSSKAAYQSLERLYDIVRLYVNFFQPSMKLINKTRQGAKVYKVYDTAQTPYQRLLNSAVLNQSKKVDLAATYNGLNPVHLLRQINDNLNQLWKLAEHYTSSVT